MLLFMLEKDGLVRENLVLGNNRICDMCGSRKFCQRGCNSDNVFVVVVFLVGEGRMDP